MKTNGNKPQYIYAVTHKMSGTYFIRHIFLELDEAMTYAQGLGEPAPMIVKYDFDESFFIELADSSKLWRTRDA